jgi:peroxiredoxin Q/BCP
MATHLKAGDLAPEFSAVSTDGKIINLADYRGKKLVMYFYPMDDTPGCTKQACSLRDANAEIAARGAAILGVSAQARIAPALYRNSASLPLLADTDLIAAYGVAGSGVMVCCTLVKFSERVTFIIDETGKVADVISDPSCPDHGAEVLSLL